MKPTPVATFGGTSGARGLGFRLIGVVHESHAGDAVRLAGADTSSIAFRDVTAVGLFCSPRAEAVTSTVLLNHHELVANVARTVTIIPAPAMTVFRSTASVRQWLELHAVTLADGLVYADGRCAARVTAKRDLAGATSDPLVLPPSAAAIESFRALRRYARATVPVSSEMVGDGTTIATESFLVERTSWDRFADEVLAEDERSPGLTLRLTGPWPVYDFVRLQF